MFMVLSKAYLCTLFGVKIVYSYPFRCGAFIFVGRLDEIPLERTFGGRRPQIMLLVPREWRRRLVHVGWRQRRLGAGR